MRVLLAACWLWFFLFTASTALAQQVVPLDLTLSPSVVEIAVQPGKLVTQAFTVQNAGTADLLVTPTLRDFTSDNQSGTPVLLETNSLPFASLQNAHIALNTPFLLKANSSEQLVFALNVPSDALERDWYSAFVLQTQPAEPQKRDGSGGEVHGTIAANLLIRVSQTNQVPLSWKLHLEGVPSFADSLQSLHLKPIVTNTSSTLAAPELTLYVLDGKGNIVYEQSGLPDRILAQSTREIAAAQPKKEDPRSLEPAEFRFQPLFAFGPYTVRASIRNAAEKPVVIEQSYFAFPFSLAITFLLAVGGVRLIQVWRKHKKKTL